MSATDIQSKADDLRSKINGATDIDKLKEFSVKVVDLLVKVDQLVDLGEERRALIEHKLESVTTVANGLIAVFETIEESFTIKEKVPAYYKVIEAAKAIIKS